MITTLGRDAVWAESWPAERSQASSAASSMATADGSLVDIMVAYGLGGCWPWRKDGYALCTLFFLSGISCLTRSLAIGCRCFPDVFVMHVMQVYARSRAGKAISRGGLYLPY